MKERINLMIDPELKEKAKAINMNVSDFLDTKLRESLEGISIPTLRIYNHFFRDLGYTLDDELKVNGVSFCVVNGYIKILLNLREDPEIWVNNLQDERVNKKDLMLFVTAQRAAVAI